MTSPKLKGCYFVHRLGGNGLVCHDCFHNDPRAKGGSYIPLIVRRQTIKQRKESDFYYNDKCCLCEKQYV